MYNIENKRSGWRGSGHYCSGASDKMARFKTFYLQAENIIFYFRGLQIWSVLQNTDMILK